MTKVNNMMPNRLEQLQEFLKENPDDSFLIYAIASEYLKIEDFDNALNHFENLISNFPDYLATYYQLGMLYQLLGRLDEAQQTFLKGMDLATRKRDLHTLGELKSAYNRLNGEDDEDEDW